MTFYKWPMRVIPVHLFVFIADCTEKTLDLFLWATSELAHQVPLLSDPDEHGSNTLYDHILDNDNDESSGDNASGT